MNVSRLWAHQPDAHDALFALIGDVARAGGLSAARARHPGDGLRVDPRRLLLLARVGRQARGRGRPRRWRPSVLTGADTGLSSSASRRWRRGRAGSSPTPTAPPPRTSSRSARRGSTTPRSSRSPCSSRSGWRSRPSTTRSARCPTPSCWETTPARGGRRRHLGSLSTSGGSSRFHRCCCRAGRRPAVAVGRRGLEALTVDQAELVEQVEVRRLAPSPRPAARASGRSRPRGSPCGRRGRTPTAARRGRGPRSARRRPGSR